jgi:hypothetical protein
MTSEERSGRMRKTLPEQMMMISAGTSRLLVPAEIIIICSGQIFWCCSTMGMELCSGR